MTNAFSGVGALLRKYDGSSWVSLGEVKSISGPSMSREMLDATSLNSTGGYREFIPGLRDPGGVTFDMNFIRADYDEMKTDFESNSAVDYELILPDTENTTLEFSGYVTELPLEVPEGIVMCSVTMKISGQVTVNSGTHSGPL
jgi:predicted secreted protein